MCLCAYVCVCICVCVCVRVCLSAFQVRTLFIFSLKEVGKGGGVQSEFEEVEERKSVLRS